MERSQSFSAHLSSVREFATGRRCQNVLQVHVIRPLRRRVRRGGPEARLSGDAVPLEQTLIRPPDISHYPPPSRSEEPCCRYNKGLCSSRSCRYDHYCNNCYRSTHPAIECKKPKKGTEPDHPTQKPQT